MSEASERARALLAAATQWRWTASDEEHLAVVDGDGTLVGHNVGEWRLRRADARLIAEACSPDGGLLATLAGEVEALEAARDMTRFIVRETYNDTEAGRHVAALTAANTRLRAALEAARREHDAICAIARHVNVNDACLSRCGADEHNARIDAALTVENARLRAALEAIRAMPCVEDERDGFHFCAGPERCAGAIAGAALDPLRGDAAKEAR